MSEPDLLAFQRLFDSLGLDPDRDAAAGRAPAARLPPPGPRRRARRLPGCVRNAGSICWPSAAPEVLKLLEPMPWCRTRTALNLNTAGELAIAASIPGLDRRRAPEVAARDRAPVRTLPAASASAAAGSCPRWSRARRCPHARFFLVTGRLRSRPAGRSAAGYCADRRRS